MSVFLAWIKTHYDLNSWARTLTLYAEKTLTSENVSQFDALDVALRVDVLDEYSLYRMSNV